MPSVEAAIDALAERESFAGVVRVDRGDDVVLAKAYGLANRADGTPNTIDTQFGTASGTKTLTALAVVSLVEAGVLDLSTPARAFLGDDLPLVRDDVTVEQLLAHRSGIGDYLDENTDMDFDEFLLPVPVDQLVATEDYLVLLDGHATKSAPDAEFAYCNGGYVILALMVERATGVAYHDLVTSRVCEPAGMSETAFLRTDALPARAAIGYVSDVGSDRTNELHLPVRGTGDGGAYTTVADIHALWTAFFDGRIVAPKWVDEMVRPRSDVPEESSRYGLGFWLHATTPTAMLEGCDAGVSFHSVHDPVHDITNTVLSNTTSGAWSVTKLLDELLGT